MECRLGILLGLCGLIASRLGRLWVAFDVFSQFTLHFALITLAFLLGLVMPRAKLLTAFVVLVAGVVGIGMWPHLASRQPAVFGTAGPGEKALKVASFNTLWVNQDADAVKAEILRLDADVVTLIEMSPAKRRIAGELKDRYPHQANCFGVDYCDLAILSKLPIMDSEARSQWEGPPYIRARLGPEAGGLTVVGVHTLRFPHSRAQLRQVSAIAGFIETLSGPKLVMGDFNATPFSRIITLMESKANLRRLTFLPSWPSHANLPQISIDHIFVSPTVRLLGAAHIGEPAGSDHYPVAAQIGVPLAP
ncbi:endonuclease/exonuclease/phosphatase family protein [Aestuariivirga sp.]|uniref:endonuclease/exonuclease/phosphatase family protein n=1 Tax=Aestuariivirga sp. TaxID=2650926 RepID=UPI00391BE43A